MITWESLYDPTDIENHILAQHKKHFAQAHSTDFTKPPLSDLIDDKCQSDDAQQILSGMAEIDDLPIPQATKDLL